uniref:Uncharacterized protein n=1 Tax=Glossina palpalis gambiensis TaxID=67801 RepID=A0A1B0BPK6_9MUSC
MAPKRSWHAGPGDNGSSVEKPTLANGIVNDKCTATLECTIANQENEIKSLLNQEEILRDQVEKLEEWIEGIYKTPENSFETVRHWPYLELGDELKELTNHKNAFESEQNTLQKVQDTLAIAAVALVDEDYDLKSEKVPKEECDNMTSTIRKGMDEAAEKFFNNLKIPLATQEMNENLWIQVKQMALKSSKCPSPGDNGSRDEPLRENPTSVCGVVDHKCTATLGCTIANQEAKIKILLSQEETLRDQVEKLEKWIEELGDQLKELTKHNNALESAMKQSKIAFECEQNALQKVQDTLAIAGVALVDKDYDLKSEKFLKEECDDMASTIGKGTDEAAGKDKKEMLI